MARHPNDVLYRHRRPFPIIPSCEHIAGTERFILKAFELQKTAIFDVTIDLEDGAPEGREREHAQMAVDLLRSEANAARRAGVRIHGARHPSWQEDVETIVRGAGEIVRYITCPKVESVLDVREVAACVESTPARRIPLHVLIETHGGLEDAFAIAAHPSVETLDFGLMDFVSDHHGAIPRSAMRSPGQFEHALVRRAKARISAAAHAGGAVPSHNVTLDFRSAEQTRADARRACEELAYLRMWSVHPAQIEPIIAAFRPDYSEVERAARVLLAAQNADWAPIEIDGALQDRASYRFDWDLFQRARLAGLSLPEDALRAFFP